MLCMSGCQSAQAIKTEQPPKGTEEGRESKDDLLLGNAFLCHGGLMPGPCWFFWIPLTGEACLACILAEGAIALSVTHSGGALFAN